MGVEVERERLAGGRRDVEAPVGIGSDGVHQSNRIESNRTRVPIRFRMSLTLNSTVQQYIHANALSSADSYALVVNWLRGLSPVCVRVRLCVWMWSLWWLMCADRANT